MRRKPVRWIERLDVAVFTETEHRDLLLHVGFENYIRWGLYKLDRLDAELMVHAKKEQILWLLEAKKIPDEDRDVAIDHLYRILGMDRVVKQEMESYFGTRTNSHHPKL